MGITLACVGGPILVYLAGTNKPLMEECPRLEVVDKLLMEALDIFFRADKFKVTHRQATEMGTMVRWAEVAGGGNTFNQVSQVMQATST